MRPIFLETSTPGPPNGANAIGGSRRIIWICLPYVCVLYILGTQLRTHQRLQHNVRKHFKFRLGFNDWPQLVDRHPPLTKEQIQQFEKPGVTIYDIFPDKKFHIDFEQNWANFRFNVVARDEFIEDFINCVGSGWYPTPAVPKKYVVEYYVGQALDTWMATCRKEYRAVKNPPDPVKAAERAEQVARDGRRGTVSWRISSCKHR